MGQIKVVDGDLLNAKESYIAHQVNCYGAMGRGVALQIRHMYPDVYRRYKAYCEEHRVKNLLGRILIIPTDDGRIICNLFGQEGYGQGKCNTDIAALTKCFQSLEKIVPHSESIAMPYQIGCGLGGGNWDLVLPLIQDIFVHHTVVVYRYK
jgi:O-acetyl-ADP-ribose deacetylase (regulator of RNase III)